MACGSTFSLAREVSLEEAIDLVEDFRGLESNLFRLSSEFPECVPLQHSRAMIRQEKFEIAQRSQGRVFVFGVGMSGELGVGRQCLLSTSPLLLHRLRHISITHVACGAHHSLAIDSEGFVYSWGSNLHGKLGQQHYNDLYEPQRIRYLLNFFARDCSAGDNHSAVIIASRDSLDRHRVCCFGRGAHGRLGHNSNKGSPFPVLTRLGAYESDTSFLQVACGGAHTLLLVLKSVPVSLSYPSGKQTIVLAWGYGSNGQLGDGKRRDSLVPVKSIFQKFIIIAQVAAGKTWSLARTRDGDLFSVTNVLLNEH